MINDRYQIKKKLGEGRSKVFLCTDIESAGENKNFAVKILPSSAGAAEIETFHDEYITLRRLHHPGIIQPLGYGTIVKINSAEEEVFLGSKYSCQEYFDGKSLLDYNDLDDEEVLKSIITQICAALFYLHQSNYIYYDLKPENILVKNINGEPFVKLIDLGFAQRSDSQTTHISNKNYIVSAKNSVRGTAEYIAPELLKNEPHDNRVDLYSLGIILYRIVYKKFPFDISNELNIYKAHIEQDFEFSKSRYSESITAVIKKLLEKNQQERYRSAVDVLYDLDIPINIKITKDWIPAKIFSNRRDVLNILDTYINDKSSSEIFTIKGFEGSGKTSICEEVNFNYGNSIYIKYEKSVPGYQFLKYLLKEIIFNNVVYNNTPDELKKAAENTIINPTTEFSNEFKGIISRITKEVNFILILDDFNSYDNFAFEMMKEILPILQVNRIKVIAAEDSDLDYLTGSFQNVKEINLTPFTDNQVSELIEKSYTDSFPKEDLKKLILLYADLLPGSIEGFIRDCLQLNIIQYKKNKIEIEISETTGNLLKGSHEQIYEIRLGNLSDDALEAAKLISLFNLNPDENVLGILLGTGKDPLRVILDELRDNNILHPLSSGSKLQFTSESLKKYIYSYLPDKRGHHLKAAKILKNKFPEFDRSELARQFEMGEDYDSCYGILSEEILEAEKLSALSYKKDILTHLQNLPLNEVQKFEVDFELSRVLKRGNEYKDCFEITNKLLNRELETETELELLIQKGICLIALRELESGKDLLISIIDRISDPPLKEEVRLEIANANFNLSNYREAEKICIEIIKNKRTSTATCANAYNLMALIKIFSSNDLEHALMYFEKALKGFEGLNQKVQMTKIEINIGNILANKGEHENAEKHWNLALNINSSIGNLLSEALIKLNMGAALYYNKLDLQNTIGLYKRAYNIFLNLGDVNGECAVLNNLAENYLTLNDFQNCYNSVKKSLELYDKIQNIEDKIDALFLLSKLYSLIGKTDEADSITEECKYIEQKYDIGMKYKNYINYIYLLSIKDNSEILRTEKLENIGNTFFKLNEINNFIEIYLELAEYLISLNKDEEALIILNNINLIENCKSRILYEAERLFLLGKISLKKEIQISEPFINLIKRSFELIKDEAITELTWKILLDLSEYYYKRGNYKKAKENIIYAKSVISYISDKIEDKELREIYLNSECRKNAAERINFLELELSK